MALRIDSRSCDADNNLGLITAARSDWHHEPADFHLGTGHQDPTHDAEYTTASVSRIRQKLSIILYLREESIYGLLGSTLRRRMLLVPTKTIRAPFKHALRLSDVNREATRRWDSL